MEEGKKKVEYRSSLRSKALIKRALLELMQEKSFDKISVSDIVRKADINRGTFYAHFKNPHDVLLRIQDDMFSELTAVLNKYSPDEVMADPVPVFKQVSEFLLSDIAYYRMLFRIAGVHEYLLDNKNRIFNYFLGSDIIRNLDDKDFKREFIALLDFWVSGVFNIYYDAVLERIPLRLDEVPSFCAKVVSLSSNGTMEFINVLKN